MKQLARKLIRKWLGITNTNTDDFVTATDTRIQIREALRQALSEDDVSSYRYEYVNSPGSLRGELRRHALSITTATLREYRKQQDSDVKEVADEHVKSEQFIDDIVQRIRDKQL